MNKIILAAAILGVSVLAQSPAVQAAQKCVTLKNGKKACGKPYGAGVFAKTDHGWCFVYYNGKFGTHVDCANPKKVLSNGNL